MNGRKVFRRQRTFGSDGAWPSARERIALNHDRLWREFLSHQPKQTAEIMPEMRRLMEAGLWDKAHDLLLTKIPISGETLYVNPFVPVCDLGLFSLPRIR